MGAKASDLGERALSGWSTDLEYEAPVYAGVDATVEYHGARLPAVHHMYNSTWLNERAAELAVVKHWLSTPEPGWAEETDALEVGNVLAHYGLQVWDGKVVDRYEPGDGVVNADVFDITGEFGCIVAVSTLEHVRWDEPDVPRVAGAAAEALEHLAGLLAPGGRMIVTVPTGHNAPFDWYLQETAGHADRCCTLVRDMQSWRQTPDPEFRPYGFTQPWAEAVWIGEWVHPDQKAAAT